MLYIEAFSTLLIDSTLCWPSFQCLYYLCYVLGTLCSLYVERPADPVDGFDKKAPLVYNFGHLSPGHNIALYNKLVSQMAAVINKRCQDSPEANFGGVIINTCGWVKGEG